MLKNLLKTFFYSTVRWWPVRGAVVLMYHSVGDNPEFFTVRAGNFDKQMAYLVKQKFNVITAPSLSVMLAAKQPIPPKTIVITFDDGYEDNYIQALPILKKYQLPAAVFLITDRISRTNTTRRGHTFPMLNWEQIRAMDASGLVEFYPHTHTHPKLPTILPEAITKEILTSRQILQEQLGGKRDIFAYPYGQCRPDAVEILKKNNFKVAFTVKSGRVQNKEHPPPFLRADNKTVFSHSMF